jgi:hypothetical protein
MNSKIINEFERLIAFINNQLDKAQSDKDLKKVTANQFRIRQLKNVLYIIFNFDFTIKYNY